jgi:hypothetical protein
LRLRRKEAEVTEKNRIRKKIVSPKNALLLSAIKITWDLVNVKNPEGIRSVRVL